MTNQEIYGRLEDIKTMLELDEQEIQRMDLARASDYAAMIADELLSRLFEKARQQKENQETCITESNEYRALFNEAADKYRRC